MAEIELSEATLQAYQDIAALQTESWRSAYRGILPGSYLDGPILEERQTHWQNLMLSADGKRRGVFLAKDRGALLGFACVLLDEDPVWGARLDNIHVRPPTDAEGQAAYYSSGPPNGFPRANRSGPSTCSFSRQIILRGDSTKLWMVELWSTMPSGLPQESLCPLSVSFGRNLRR